MSSVMWVCHTQKIVGCSINAHTFHYFTHEGGCLLYTSRLFGHGDVKCQQQYSKVEKDVVRPLLQTTPPLPRIICVLLELGDETGLNNWTFEQPNDYHPPLLPLLTSSSCLADYCVSLVAPDALLCWLVVKSTHLCPAWHPFSCCVKAYLVAPLAHWLVVELPLSHHSAPIVLW